MQMLIDLAGRKGFLILRSVVTKTPTSLLTVQADQFPLTRDEKFHLATGRLEDVPVQSRICLGIHKQWQLIRGALAGSLQQLGTQIHRSSLRDLHQGKFAPARWQRS
jgi:hypothetical protein